MRKGKYLKDEAEPSRDLDGQLALVGHGGITLPTGADTEALTKLNRDREAIAQRYAQHVKFNPNHVGRVPRPKQNPANHKMVIPKSNGGN